MKRPTQGKSRGGSHDFGTDYPGQVRAGEIGALKDCTREVRRLEIRAREVYIIQIHVGEVRAREVCTREVNLGADDIAVDELIEIGKRGGDMDDSATAYVPQDRAGEVYMIQVYVGEVRAGEVCEREISPEADEVAVLKHPTRRKGNGSPRHAATVDMIEIGSHEVCLRKGRAGEVRISKARVEQVRVREVRTGQIGPGELR